MTDSTGWDWRRQGSDGEDGASAWSGDDTVDAPDRASVPPAASTPPKFVPPPTPPVEPTPRFDPGAVPLVGESRPVLAPSVSRDPDVVAREQIWAESRYADTRRTRRRLGGSRLSGRAVFGVFGLISILATIAILGVLGSRMLSGIDEPRGLPMVEAPVGGGLSAASTCASDRRSLETAVNAHRLLIGEPPADQRAMVDAGVLSEQVSGFELGADPPGTIVGVGRCAGF
jgi:hypothetical protein